MPLPSSLCPSTSLLPGILALLLSISFFLTAPDKQDGQECLRLVSPRESELLLYRGDNSDSEQTVGILKKQLNISEMHFLCQCKRFFSLNESCMENVEYNASYEAGVQ